MNIRLTILLVFVLALFGALALWFRPWDQSAEPSRGRRRGRGASTTSAIVRVSM